MAALILNLDMYGGTSSIPWSLLFIHKRMLRVGSQNWSGSFGRQKTLLLRTGIKTRFLDQSARIATTSSRLLHSQPVAIVVMFLALRVFGSAQTYLLVKKRMGERKPSLNCHHYCHATRAESELPPDDPCHTELEAADHLDWQVDL
jgi:hypothetical protein